MENLTFKYYGLTPIYSLMSRELERKVEFIHNSRIDALPLFNTTDIIFEQNIIDILNYQHMDKLSMMLRKSKLNKLLKNTEPTLEYEFLNFWYNHSKELHLMIPI